MSMHGAMIRASALGALSATVAAAIAGNLPTQGASRLRALTLHGAPALWSADVSPDGTVAVLTGTGALLKTQITPATRLHWVVGFWQAGAHALDHIQPVADANPTPYDSRHPVLPSEHYIRYSNDGHFLLGLLHRRLLVLSVDGFHLGRVCAIDLNLSPDRPSFVPVYVAWSPDNTHAAVLFSYRNFHEGVVRVYNLMDGKLSWERSFDLVEMGHAAWSAHGGRLAVTLLTGRPGMGSAYPPRPVPNLLILSAATGETLLAIRTHDPAGPVCFAPDNRVLTVPLHFVPKSYEGPLWADKVKVWDGTTGQLVRQIGMPGRDIHADSHYLGDSTFGDSLQLSRDGQVLLAYVGKEKSGFSWHAMEDVWQIVDRRFELFDYATGKPIVTSPDLTSSSPGCVNQTPSFRLGVNGRRVLVYWPDALCAPSVFELR